MRWKMIAAMIVGSFLIYCGQTATTPDGGFMPDADAEASCGCTMPQTFTKLADGALAPGATAEVAVGQYREVVIYQTSLAPAGCSYFIGYRFRPDANTEYGYTGQNQSGRIRVDGADMRISVSSTSTPACTSVGFVVAGVR